MTPQERWQQKAGLISKSYKLQRGLVEEFAEACERNGTTQARQLSKMMEGYIDEQKGGKRDVG